MGRRTSEARRRVRALLALLVLGMVYRESAARRGYGTLAAGFVLTVAGFGVILYEIWATATIPLNNVTFVGIAVAALGIAAAVVGLDRGEKK